MEAAAAAAKPKYTQPVMQQGSKHHPYGHKFHWEQKIKMTEDFLRYKDHTRLPLHPAVTGKLNQCWACAKDADAEKCVFNMNVSPRLPDPKNPEPVKVCIFCSIECWMGGWPLVRHHYILAGGEAIVDPVVPAGAKGPKVEKAADADAPAAAKA